MFNEAEDRTVRNLWKGKASWLNNKNSWKNKWKLDKKGNPLPFQPKWYYFGFRCKNKERFFLSSTALVF